MLKSSPSPDNGRLPLEFRTRGIADIMIMRSIIGFLGTWQSCHAACRRHKGCLNPTVACFDLNRQAIRETLEELADWPRLDGPRTPEETAGPIGDMFD